MELEPGTPSAPRPARLELYQTFALIGLFGFGGVLPWARRQLVDRSRWMDDYEFAQLFSLGQLMPGPNIANCAVIYGRRLHGPSGSLAAVCGLYTGPAIITIVLGLLYARYGQLGWVRQMFGAMMPVAAGLLVGTALRLGKSLPRNVTALVMVPLVFVVMGLLDWPLWLVLITAIPLALALTWWRPGEVAPR